MHFFDYDFDVTGLCLACFVGAGCGQSVHRDRPNHGLAYKCSGENVYYFENGRTVGNRKGEIIYLPKGSSYHVKSMESGDCFAINFELREDIRFEPFSVEVKDTAAFLELFRRCERLWKQKDHGYRLKCKALLYEILYKMQQERQHYVSSDKYERIQPAVTYINTHYTVEPLHISDLAAMCEMTPEYFRRIFKDRHGVSPVQYIRHLRTDRLAELLSSGMYTVAEAAALSGFDDLSYCSREFKKRFGRSPREYMKKAP